MPDGDIFSQTVSRPWVKAARLAFGAGDDAATVSECERVLVRDLNERPWDGFAEAVRDIAEAVASDDDPLNRRHVLKHLEWYRDRWPADRYEAVGWVANRLLAPGMRSRESADPAGNSAGIELRIASAILEKSIMMKIAPACKAEQLAARRKMTIDRFFERSQEIRMLLSSSKGLQGIAGQVMRTSGRASRRIQAPRKQSTPLPQSEIVNLPIG